MVHLMRRSGAVVREGVGRSCVRFGIKIWFGVALGRLGILVGFGVGLERFDGGGLVVR